MKLTVTAVAAGVSAYVGAHVGTMWAALLGGMGALLAITIYDEIVP